MRVKLKTRPPNVDVRLWLRLQICSYLTQYPDHGPKKIIILLRSQPPNPWPEASENSIGKFLQRLRGVETWCQNIATLELTREDSLACYEVMPDPVK